MKSYFDRLVLTAALVLFLPQGLQASDAAPHISGLELNQGESDVLLSARLVTELGEEMREALRGGVPLTFSYRVRLTKKGTILGEKIVRRREIIHSLEFDPVKQLFLFTGEGYSKQPIEKTTKDEDEALDLLTSISDWRLYPLRKLDRNVRYRVRVMATLRSVELPSVLGYLFFFTTIFNQETQWVQLDFTF